MERKSIIKQSSTIRTALHKRITELNLSYTQLKNEAEKFGVKGVRIEMLSRYFSGTQQGKLPEDAIIFLCLRYGIDILLGVGTPVISAENRLLFKILPYNEDKAIGRVKMVFKTTTNVKKSKVKAE